MADNIIELSQETAAKVDRILWLLEGDQYRPGLLTHVQRNAEEIERLKQADSRNSVSTSTLLGVAYAIAIVQGLAVGLPNADEEVGRRKQG